jgi:hypothetical protein
MIHSNWFPLTPASGGSTSLPSTSLRDGEHSRTVTILSQCFDSAQHPEFIEGSKDGIFDLPLSPRERGLG